MKLEVGKSYRTRNGKVISIIKRGYNPYPYIGIDKEGLARTFTEDGHYRANGTESEFDLIEEVIEEPKLKLEVGKYYRTKNDYKVKIVATNVQETPRPIIGVLVNNGAVALFDEDGTHLFESDSIICEWEEPFVLDFDWACLPVWLNYIAMDVNETWFAYEDKPTKKACVWHSDKHIKIPKDYAPKNFTGSWEDSIFMNPKYKQDEN